MVIKGYLLPFIGQLVNRILVSHAPHAACRRHPLVWLNWAKGYQELGQICSKFATISAMSTQSTERSGAEAVEMKAVLFIAQNKLN